jgi:hypothetical protein
MEMPQIERMMRIAKAGKTGPYVLAIMPPLTNQELAHFPRTQGVRAEGVVNHSDSQSIIFRHWHFGMQTGVDRDEGFIEFASLVADNYQIEDFDPSLRQTESWREPIF